MMKNQSDSFNYKLLNYSPYLIRLLTLCLLNLPYLAIAKDIIQAQSSDSPRLSIQATSSGIPGELKETNIATESIWTLKPGWSWLTTTSLSGMRHNSLIPFRTENTRITTGPRLKIGSADIFLPFQTGYEIATGSGHMTWVSSSPGLKIAVSNQDSIQIDTRFKTSRIESIALQNIEYSKSIALSWRHNFDDNWSIRMGLRQQTDADSLREDNLREGFARVTARLSNDWWWTLSGSISDTLRNPAGQGDYGLKDNSSSMSIGMRHVLNHGWELSGTLSGSQATGDTGPYSNRSGTIKLYRGF